MTSAHPLLDLGPSDKEKEKLEKERLEKERKDKEREKEQKESARKKKALEIVSDDPLSGAPLSSSPNFPWPTRSPFFFRRSLAVAVTILIPSFVCVQLDQIRCQWRRWRFTSLSASPR